MDSNTQKLEITVGRLDYVTGNDDTYNYDGYLALFSKGGSEYGVFILPTEAYANGFLKGIADRTDAKFKPMDTEVLYKIKTADLTQYLGSGAVYHCLPMTKSELNSLDTEYPSEEDKTVYAGQWKTGWNWARMALTEPETSLDAIVRDEDLKDHPSSEYRPLYDSHEFTEF